MNSLLGKPSNKSLRDLVIEGFANINNQISTINTRLANLEKFTVEQRQLNKNTDERLSNLESTISTIIKVNNLMTK